MAGRQKQTGPGSVLDKSFEAALLGKEIGPGLTVDSVQQPGEYVCRGPQHSAAREGTIRDCCSTRHTNLEGGRRRITGVLSNFE